MLGSKLRNKYDVMLDRLEESEWRHQIPRKYRSRHDGKRCISGDWGMKDLSRKRMNRPKRMREHRQEEREKYLESMSRRENNIMDLTIAGSSFVREELDFILRAMHGTRYDFRSVTGPYKKSGSDSVILAITGAVADAELLDTNTTISDERLDYILDSITRYQHLDLSQYDNAVICVQYSSRHSVSDAALTEFYSRLKVFFGYDDIRTGKIVENGDEREVKAVLLLNKM